VSGFLQQVENEVQKRGLFSRGQRMLVAVSGGVDSMVLLHALNMLAPKNRWEIGVIHFNHQLRGPASAADEKLVRSVAKRLRLPFYGGSAAVKAIAASKKLSLEMAARQLRHEFLARIARQQKITTVALAHHADDQVELFFLRVLRGSGSEGLAGMKWRSPSPVNKMISLARPLLGFSKTEIMAFAQSEKILFRDDATNFENNVLRNRIRNELLPLLKEKYQPGLTKTVLRLMEIAGAESGLVDEIAQQTSPARGRNFESLPPAVQRKKLQQQLIESGVTPDFDLVEQLREAAGTFVSIGAEISAARDAAGRITVRQQMPVPAFKPGELKLKLSGRGGAGEFGARQFSWAVKKYDPLHKRPSELATEFYDADKIGHEVVLRHWRAGDRFQPIGLRSATKLQDLFVNAKIPAPQRRRLVLATTGDGEIFWVEGLRIGERFKLTPATKRQIVWKWSTQVKLTV
jgi:tRNA(Ile)-lysidine synthase